MNNHNRIKNIEEKECVKRFLPYYCQESNREEKGIVIKKNSTRDEIEVDIFVEFKNEDKLKIQVTVADSSSTTDFRTQISRKSKGKTIRHNLISSIRDQHDMRPVLKAIDAKMDLYKKQGKEMSDIFLLIDDQMGDFPKSAVNNINWNPYKNYFKEVWYIGRTCCIYKIL
jgi:hypothetical protein